MDAFTEAIRGKRGRVMNDLIREQCFCQWVISKILALYITQEDFRNEVDSKLKDGRI